MISANAICPHCKTRGGEVLLDIGGVEEIECYQCGSIWQRVRPDVIHSDPLTHYVQTGECQ